MEATGVAEAAQALEVGIKGIDSALRLTGSFAGWTINSICQLVKFILNRIEKQRNSPETLSPGEMPLDKLMKYNSERREKTCVMQLDEQIQPEFIEYCRTNNLSYSFLTDVNLTDGQKEVVYSESQAEAFGVFIRKYPAKARVYSFTDYLNNATPEAVMEADKNLSEETKKTVERRYSEDVIPLSELSEKSLNMSAVTFSEEQYNSFKLKNPELSHSILLDRAGKITVAIADADYQNTDVFLNENGLKRQNLAEFLNENRTTITPDDTLIKCARAGSNRKNLKSVIISDRQITNINKYSAFVRISDEGAASYISVPLDMIKKTEEDGKWNVLIPSDENIHVYDKMAAFKGGETLSSYIDSAMDEKTEVEDIKAEKTIAFPEAKEKLSKMQKHFEEKKKTKDISLSDKYIYEPVATAAVYNSTNINQSGEKAVDVPNKKANEETVGRNIEEITINIDTTTENPLLVKETEDSYFTRVPRSNAEDYIYIPKSESELIRDSKTIFTRLDLNKEYKIYDVNGKYKYSRTGDYLVKNNYSSTITAAKKTKDSINNIKDVKENTPRPTQHIRHNR